MSDKELNEEYIRNETGLIENDELIPIIRKMLSDQYINGLEQGKFDAMMDKINLINWLEEQNKFHYVNGKIENNYVRVDEVLRMLK